jgi:hypothetical protein
MNASYIKFKVEVDYLGRCNCTSLFGLELSRIESSKAGRGFKTHKRSSGHDSQKCEGKNKIEIGAEHLPLLN